MHEYHTRPPKVQPDPGEDGAPEGAWPRLTRWRDSIDLSGGSDVADALVAGAAVLLAVLMIAGAAACQALGWTL